MSLAAVGTSGLIAQQPDAETDGEGARLFDSYCTACHQYDDQGMGEAPPLHRSPWVDGPAERLIRILLHGIEGRIELHGKVYDREMPGFGGVLSDHQIAAMATYIRRRFSARDEPVSAASVGQVRQRHAGRKAYWPASELLELN